jgi:hypothetical protein
MRRIATLVACGALWTLAGAAQQAPPAATLPFTPAAPEAEVSPASSPAGPASLSAAVAPSQTKIGDRLRAELTLRATAPLDGPPRFPVWEQHWGDAEILATEEARDEGDGLWRQALTLTVFETGSATLPAVAVEVPLADGTTFTARSAPVVVPVTSVLPAVAEEEKALPPEPVRSLPMGRGFWWTGGALLLACTALAWLLWRVSRPLREAVAALRLSPYEALRAALGRLRRESDGERLMTGLSLEVRRYIGRALGFPAAEGTTTEIQRRLRDRGLPPDLVRETLDLLREADRVKFARGAVDRPLAEGRLTDGERLAARVENWLRPPEPVAGAAGADSPEAAA